MPRKSIIDDANALHFKTNGQPTGQSGRKDRNWHRLQGSGMIHINISMGVTEMHLFFFSGPGFWRLNSLPNWRSLHSASPAIMGSSVFSLTTHVRRAYKFFYP